MIILVGWLVVFSDSGLFVPIDNDDDGRWWLFSSITKKKSFGFRMDFVCFKDHHHQQQQEDNLFFIFV